VARSPLLPIFLIVLVDILGFTIVIPLLAFYAERFGASPLVATTLVSIYAVCSLISTPIIGNLSDRYGRKRLLMISQAGTCLGFLMLASSSSLWMVFVGRILDGATAGNLSLAQAYISDHTAPENRAKAFGVIGVAFGIGFMFGPGLGGMLGKYGLHVPFLVAASLSALSMFCTHTLLREDRETKPGAAADGPGGRRPGAFAIATYTAYFRRPRLGSLYLQFFCFAFAFSAFMSGFALFAERRFTVEHHVRHVAGTCNLEVSDSLQLPHAKSGSLRVGETELVYDRDWIIADKKTLEVRGDACAKLTTAHVEARFPWTSREVGLLFMFAGLLGILLQGGLLGRLVRRFGEAQLAVAGFAAAAASYVVLGFTYTLSLLVVTTVLHAFGHGVIRPSLTSQITRAAGREEQGVAIGISGSLNSFAMIIAPPTGGTLLDLHHLVAWTLVPATAAILGCIVALISRPRATTTESAPRSGE
jgi:MFS family permease